MFSLFKMIRGNASPLPLTSGGMGAMNMKTKAVITQLLVRTCVAVSFIGSLTAVGCGSSTSTPTLVSIAVTPPSPSIAVGAQQQFVATGTFSDKTTMNVSSTVTWMSATPAAATLSSSGQATGVAPGSTVISATQ